MVERRLLTDERTLDTLCSPCWTSVISPRRAVTARPGSAHMAKRPKPRTPRPKEKIAGRTAAITTPLPESPVTKTRKTMLDTKKAVARAFKARFDAAHADGM